MVPVLEPPAGVFRTKRGVRTALICVRFRGHVGDQHVDKPRAHDRGHGDDGGHPLARGGDRGGDDHAPPQAGTHPYRTYHTLRSPPRWTLAQMRPALLRGGGAILAQRRLPLQSPRLGCGICTIRKSVVGCQKTQDVFHACPQE